MGMPKIAMPEVKANDALIFVMGPSGSGKSTLINNVLRSPVAVCDDGYESCTCEIRGYEVPEGNVLYSHIFAEGVQGRLIIIDTPGLDSDRFEGLNVLEAIRECLQAAVEKKAMLAGMIYTYYFWPGRMREENMIDLDIFSRICGDNFWSRVVVGMTHADGKDQAKQEDDEFRNKFWEKPLDRGAQLAFLRNSLESAEALAKLLPPLGILSLPRPHSGSDTALTRWALNRLTFGILFRGLA